MAGVYIKGMDKPKECRDCPFNIVGLCTAKVAVFGKESLHDPGELWCPLVEVPDHGDLIDRETIVDSVCDGVCSCSECSFNQNPFDSCVLQTNLEKLKVVIPADKEGV